jgi:hypothetical protein
MIEVEPTVKLFIHVTKVTVSPQGAVLVEAASYTREGTFLGVVAEKRLVNPEVSKAAVELVRLCEQEVASAYRPEIRPAAEPQEEQLLPIQGLPTLSNLFGGKK